MAETNELLKQHSALLNNVESTKPIEIKQRFEKLEKQLSEQVKKEVSSRYERLVKEKVELCLQQVQEFLAK